MATQERRLAGGWPAALLAMGLVLGVTLASGRRTCRLFTPASSAAREVSAQTAGRWVYDGTPLRARWGSLAGEVGRRVWDADAGEQDVYLVTSGPSAVTVGVEGSLCITDAINYRVQIFTKDGKLRRVVGRRGERRGEFSQPPCRAVVGPSGDIYVTQSGLGNRRMPMPGADATTPAEADDDAWRSGVIRLSANGAFIMSTHEAKGLPFRPSEGPAVGPLFWVDGRGRVYEGFGNDHIACFTADGAFVRHWSLGSMNRFVGLELGPEGVFYHARKGAAARLPTSLWAQPVLIERWDTSGKALSPFTLDMRGRSDEWGTELRGIDRKGRLVALHYDAVREKGGLVRADRIRASLLLIGSSGSLLATQDLGRLLASVPRPGKETPGSTPGLVVGPDLDLYWCLLYDDGFHIARFAWRR